ncbi:MAG: tetratricopeptide repeat protein [Bacteroidia bacterium]|nr:tetratricopeptide repeat protein [Bacteroidia bacterium]
MDKNFPMLVSPKLSWIGFFSLLLLTACQKGENYSEHKISWYIQQIDEATDYQKSYEQEYFYLNQLGEFCKKDSRDCPSVLLAKGILLFKTAYYDSALLVLDRHQDALSESGSNTYERSLGNYYRAATYTFKGSFQKAFPIIQALLRKTENKNNRNDSSLYASSLFTLGVGYSNPAEGKMDSALICLRRASHFQAEIWGAKSEQLGKSLNFLAQAFLLVQACDSSEYYYLKAIDTYQQLAQEKQNDLWVSYNGLASVMIAGYCKRNDYARALNLLHQAVSISDSLADNNPNKVVPYASRGRLYQAIGDYYSAIENYKLALSDDLQHPNYPILLSNIGAAFASMEDYPQAISYFRSALSYPKAGGVFRAFWLNNLSTAFIGLGEIDSAKIYVKKADAFKDIVSRVFQSEATEFHALLYTNYGELYRKLEDYPLAESYYQKALKVRQESQDANISLTYQKLGEIYRVQKMPEQAFAFYHKGLTSIGLSKSQVAKPDPLNLDQPWLQRPLYLLLSSLAKNWELKYQEEASLSSLEKAYEHYSYSLQIVDSML